MHKDTKMLLMSGKKRVRGSKFIKTKGGKCLVFSKQNFQKQALMYFQIWR